MTNGGAVDLGSAYGSIEVDFSQIEGQISGLLGRLDNVVSRGLVGIGGQLESIGNNIAAVGGKLTVGLAPVTAFVTKGVLAFADFDAAMAEIEARTGSTVTEMEIVRKTALQMGQDTAFSATEAASGMLELLASGMSVDQALVAIRPVLDAAAASNMGLAQAAGAVTGILAQFKLPAEDAARVANALAAASGASRAEMGDLAQAFNNVGPVASDFGLSVEETSAILAVFANKGILGAEAGTQLRSMLNNMVRPTEDVQKMWASLGVSMFDAQGNMRPIEGIIDDLNVAMAGMNDQQRIETINTLAGSYGQLGLSALLSTGGIDEMQAAMAGQTTAADMAAKKMKSFKGVTDTLMSTLETMSINILGPMVDKYLKPLIEDITELANKVSEWAGKNPDLAAKIGLVLAVLAVLGPALVFIGGMISLVGTAVGTLGVLFGVIFSPIALLIGAIAALGAGLYYVYSNNILGFQDAVNALVETVLPGFESIAEVVGKVFDAFQEGGITAALDELKANSQVLSDAFTQIWEGLKAKLPEVMMILGELAGKALTWLGEKFFEYAPLVWDGFKKVITWLVTTGIPEFNKMALLLVSSFILGFIEGFDAKALVAQFLLMMNGILAAVIPIAQQIVAIVLYYLGKASDSAQMLAAIFVGAILWLSMQARELFNSLVLTITTFLQDLVAKATTSAQMLAAIVVGAVLLLSIKAQELINWLVTQIDTGIQNLENLWNDFKQFITDLWTGISTTVGEKVDQAATKISELATRAIEWVTTAKNELPTRLGEFWNTLETSINGMATTIRDRALGIGTSIVNGLRDGINNAWDSLVGWLEDKVDDLPGALKKVLEIMSPSRVFANLGAMIPEGLKVGIDSNMQSAIDAASQMAASVANVPTPALALAGAGGTAPVAGGNTYQINLNVPLEVLRNEPKLKDNAENLASQFERALRFKGGGSVNG